jgi:hypothetical protein
MDTSVVLLWGNLEGNLRLLFIIYLCHVLEYVDVFLHVLCL